MPMIELPASWAGVAEPLRALITELESRGGARPVASPSMSMTLVLVALPRAAFDAIEADPQLLQWVHERARLDWSTTLRAYILEPGECEADDLRRMEQVDGFGLRQGDFFFANYLAVSRILDAAAAATRPPPSPANAEKVKAWLAGGAHGVLELDDVPGSASGAETPDDPFDHEGELAYDAGYGDCMYWSPAHLATAAANAAGFRVLREHTDATPFLDRALAEQRYLIGIVE